MREAKAKMGTRPKHYDGRERPHRAAESLPGPFGLRGSLPPQAAEKSQPVFWPRGAGNSNGFVRQDVRQNRKGGTKRKHGNHQGTTQATKVSDDPGTSRGVSENPARSICEIHRLHSVLRYYRSSKNLVQARRRVQNLARPARQRRQPPET